MTKDTLRKILISGIFLIPFIALINIGSLAFPFITGKAFIFRILIEIMAGIWVLLIIVEKKNRPRINWISGTILAFLIAITISDIFGINPMKSLWGNFERMDGLIGLIHLAIYFIIAGTVIDTEKLWMRLFNTTIGVSVVLSLLALIQLGGGMEISTAEGRLDSTIGNAAYFALYLLIHIFLAIFMASKNYSQPAPKSRYFYGAIVVFHTVILYFTATRGAMLGLIGGIFVAAILLAIFAREHKKLRMTALIMMAAIILIIIGFFAVRNQEFVKNNPILNRFNAISVEGMKTQARYYVWPIAIRGAQERPILGWGQENFNIVFNKDYQPALYNEATNFDRAHNIILDWLVAGGLVGLLAYLSIFFAALYYLWISAKSITEKSILTGLIAGYFINNLFIFDNITSYILFFTLLAYIYSEIKGVGENKEEKRDRKKGYEIQELIGVLIVPIGIAVIGTIYFANVSAMSAAYHFKQAYYSKDTVLPEGIKEFKAALAENSYGTEETRQHISIAAENTRSSPEFYTLASQEMLKQIQETPLDAYNYYLIGSLFYTYGNFDDAQKNLEKACELSPNKQIFLVRLIDTYTAKKDYKKAYDLAKKTYELETRYDPARMSYAVAALLNGDKETSSKLLIERYDTDLLFDQNLISAYAATNQIQKLIAIYEKHLVEKPDDIQVIISLAASYLQLGERTNAIKMLKNAEEKSTEYKDRIAVWIKQIESGQNPQ